MKYIKWIIIPILHFTYSLAPIIPFTIFLVDILQIKPNLLNLTLYKYPIEIIHKSVNLIFFQDTNQLQYFLDFFLLSKYKTIYLHIIIWCNLPTSFAQIYSIILNLALISTQYFFSLLKVSILL